MLLRILKRRALTGISSDEELCELEFTRRDGSRDLRPSVYSIQLDQCVQATVEHAASFLGDPPRTVRLVDMGGLCTGVLQTRGATKFEFTRDAHRELALPDETQLRVCASRLLAELRRHLSPVEKSEMREYIRLRFEKADQEWR
ncbi:MAG: hypothetical protein V2A73_05640, partial [Pseudomonadota bacterium]